MNASLQTASQSAVKENSIIDVLIVGAGLSGIGAAKHLQMHCPQTSWCILESRDAIGGTWDLFRYPGIRSDSDMYTLGYSFKPWLDHKSIADGSTIRQYIQKTADENGITPHIRHGHSVTHATWSSDAAPQNRWLCLYHQSTHWHHIHSNQIVWYIFQTRPLVILASSV